MGESATQFEPKTLVEAIRFFSDPATCVKYLAERRWPDGPVCPRCGGKQHSYLSTRFLWKCRECKKQFSVKVGTIFEDSPLGLDKWLPAVWLLTSSRNGVSSMELHRSLGVTQKTAWFMTHRIRYAMQTGSFNKACGQVEVDETFIGQKARNMHKGIRSRKITGTGGKDKTMVVGVLERGGVVRTTVVESRKKKTLQDHVKKHVEPGAQLFTDALPRLSPQNRPYIITSKPANEVSRRTEVLFYHGPFVRATSYCHQPPDGGVRQLIWLAAVRHLNQLHRAPIREPSCDHFAGCPTGRISIQHQDYALEVVQQA